MRAEFPDWSTEQMFDAKLRPVIDPVLHRIARLCLAAGLSANSLTIMGFGVGLVSGLLICFEAYLWALLALFVSRILDGLDGAVARLTRPTDFGGFLDIVCDFLFYAFVPFCFAVSQPEQAVAAAFLMLSFAGTGTSFLAYAILDAKYQHTASKQQSNQTERAKNKSFAYLGGLTEGAETIAVLALFMVFPDWFVPLAIGFGLLCWVTTIYRVYISWFEFGKDG